MISFSLLGLLIGCREFIIGSSEDVKSLINKIMPKLRLPVYRFRRRSSQFRARQTDAVLGDVSAANTHLDDEMCPVSRRRQHQIDQRPAVLWKAR